MSSSVGIRDEDQTVIEAMNYNAFAPMVLPVLFVLLPLIAAVLTGLTLNVLFPREAPGQWGWSHLFVWYPLEVWYVVKKWREAARGSWLSLTYWVGKKFWSNEFLVLNWRLLGKIEKSTGIVTATQAQVNGKAAPATIHPGAQVPGGTEIQPLKVPDSLKEYTYYVEFLLKSDMFPKLWVAMSDLPERELSYVGNSSMVLNGGLLFQTDHVANASFVRCDFHQDEIDNFVPIGIFIADALIAENVFEANRPKLPDLKEVEQTAIVADKDRAGLYFRKWQDAEQIIENTTKSNKTLDRRIDDRAAATIREARKAGQIPIGPGAELPRGPRKLPGSKLQWTVALGLIAVTAFIAWRLMTAG